MLIDTIKADQLAARKARDAVATALLTTLIGEATSASEEEYEQAKAAVEAADTDALCEARTDADTGVVAPPVVVVAISDEKVVATITRFLKNARANRSLLEMSAAKSLPDIEREIAILTGYLPQQMTEAQLRAVVELFKRAHPGAQVGAVMTHLKTNYAGLYDGKIASQLAKS